MYLRGDISVLVPDLFRSVVAILTAPAVSRKGKKRGTGKGRQKQGEMRHV
jgi:hypothetical protein